MSVILDTSFLIAINDKRDINHKNAGLLKEKLKSNELGQVYISDYIFDEFLTFLKAKSFPTKLIEEIGNSLLLEKTIKMLKVDDNTFYESWQMFKKFENFSFTDCATIILAKEFGIKSIASFDSDFDNAGKFRLHNLIV